MVNYELPSNFIINSSTPAVKEAIRLHLKGGYEASDNLEYLQKISKSRENNYLNNNIEKRSIIGVIKGLVALLIKF